MFETYEEKVGDALDTLYPGALFLTAGDRVHAERLVVDTVSGVDRTEVPAAITTKWFEGRMANRYLASAPVPDAEGRPPPIARGPKGIQSDPLLDGAGAVPAWARAALWLVLLRQWSYADVREALQVSKESLAEMLKHRTTLASRLLAASDDGQAEASVR